MSKYVGFFRGLRASPSPEVSFMAFFTGRDLRTVTGRNLRFLKDESGLDPWSESPARIKKVLAEMQDEVPIGDEWRLPYLGKLLEQRQRAHYSDCTSETERLSELIDSLCMN